ncbi:hypothetical protein EDD18DRAFT_1458729 [Armillaria luteobubalina]|uniref:Uncharacterized protein n=1 Tax=Armillaria luteobubalina TaxID=153913 RepID=A0AA39QIF1_9AGAR|nr:hypothetical protein EDD18DRAFT_1458729 [Armillaria luteobubalina]
MSSDDFELSSDVDNANVDLDNVKSDNKNIVLRNLAQKYPFLSYASIYWGQHARGQVELKMEREIISFLTDIDFKLDHSAHCRKVASVFHSLSEVPVPYWFAEHYGLSHIMNVFPKGGYAKVVKALMEFPRDQGLFLALLVIILAMVLCDVL